MLNPIAVVVILVAATLFVLVREPVLFFPAIGVCLLVIWLRAKQQ